MSIDEISARPGCKRGWLGLSACALAWLLCAPGWAGESAALPEDLARLRERGVLYVGYQDGAFPFAYKSASTGEHVGFSVALCGHVIARIARAIDGPGPGERTALRVSAVSITSNTRIPLLLNRSIDLECGSTTASLARTSLGDDEVGVAFSETIFWSDIAAAVPRTPLMATIGHVNQLGEASDKLPIVTTSGSTSVKHLGALAHALRRPLRTVYAPRHGDSFAMLERGEASAFVMDRVLLLSQLDPRRFRLLDGHIGTDEGEVYGLMLRKGDRALRQITDETLLELKRSGEFERIYRRWFLAPLPAPRSAMARAVAPMHPAIGLPMSDPLKRSLQVPALRADTPAKLR